MGSKSGKCVAQNGCCGYWPYASMFAGHCGAGLAPFFGGYGGYGGFGGGYGGFGGGIAPLAFPFGGFGGGFGGFGGGLTKGKVNIKDVCTGSKLKLKW